MTELRKQELFSEVDANNTTQATLGAGATFPGSSSPLTNVATILVSLYSDQDSAVDGLKLQFSPDNVTWFTTDEYTYIGLSGPKTYSVQPVYPYFRILYTNGGTIQGQFYLTTQFLTGATKPSSHRLEDNLSGQDDVTAQKAIIAAKIPKGTYQNIDATPQGSLNVHISEENQDAFGRVRVSDPITLLDSTFGYNLNPRQFEDISTGNGVAAHNGTTKAANLSITAGAPGEAGLQSYQYTHYNPGKSHLIIMTLCADPLGAGYAAGQKFEAGYFDDDNGLFARRDSTGIHVVRRSSTSGAPVEEVVDQANFNIDPLDGAGPSGITLDDTKSQILVIDLQFLGVGRVRMGLQVAGSIVYAHEFNFANANPGMYMQFGTLPVRWLLSDTGVGGFGQADAYCVMVTTEGGAEEDRGIPLATGNPTAITAASGTDTFLLAIRPKLTFNAFANRIWNVLQNAELLNTGSNEVIVKVWYAATVTGGAWADVDTSDSGMEYNVTATHAAGTGIEIARFFVPSSIQNKEAGNVLIKSRLPIAIDRAGANPIGAISITAQGIGGTSPVLAILEWREIR